MKTSVETIDEKLAAKYLVLTDHDRPISNGHLQWLIGRQRRLEWQTNGDSIKFDSNGVLRDGQHRLKMVLTTGMPIEVVVVRDIDPGAFITMDTGKNRNLADVLALKKQLNPIPLASALSWVYRYLANQLSRGQKVSHEQHLALLDKHPELHQSVAFFLNLTKPAGGPGWPAITMTSHYLFSRIDATAANDFIERYVTGLRLEEQSDPIAVLRGQIVSYATAKVKPQGDQILGLFALAWNAQSESRKVERSYHVRPRSPRRPKINGFPKELFLESQAELPFQEEEENS
jgi:hypothetical protein